MITKTNGWRELPMYRERFLNSQMVVYAYLFRGFSAIDYFDLERERWGRIQTHFLNARGGHDEWPWSQGRGGGSLTDYVACVVHGHMYVFGGSLKRAVGSNFFAVLDIEKKTKNLACWVDGEGEKVYIMYGLPDRQAAALTDKELGGEGKGVDTDPTRVIVGAWDGHSARRGASKRRPGSPDIAKGKWQRERVAGNFPCPRSELSVCYNKKINSTVLFGGNNPALPYFANIETGVVFGYNYFADTFILDHSSLAPRWRQVITPSFPTYRAQAQLLADADTGKMYLFGGYTNSGWVPAGKSDISKSYGDIWQLVIDVPGGLFEGAVDWEDERHTAQLGPWQVCYRCKAVDFHRKCGGSCGGKVFYCSADCQKEGWAELKEKHGCRR
ncbi:hypothetical protein C8Q74DRAFT_1372553 [Fomes fomentarius]|nr:hypothetical protein C8Q74DRAFT_1372553 [Fomes fomentarius]